MFLDLDRYIIHQFSNARKFDRTELGDLKILNLAFHPSGRFLATASYDPHIKIWDIEQGVCYRHLNGKNATRNWAVAFHPHRDLLASGGGGGDNTVCLWDIHSSTCCQVLNGHTSVIIGVAFSPDGSYLASSSRISPSEFGI
jgi:WD40 repeat protein